MEFSTEHAPILNDSLRWRRDVRHFVFEPTGAYHKAFEAASGNKLPLVKVNPLQARRFAEAHGTRAKTDAVDARMLARMEAAFSLKPQAPCSKETRDLRDLHVTRAGLIKDRIRLRNRAQTQDISVLKSQTKARLTLVERQIAELDAEIATLIAAQQNSARRCEILRSLPGVGAVSAAAMLTLMLKLGALDRKQVVSLAGQSVHRQRQKALRRCPLYARIGRHALQPRPQGRIRAPARGWQTRNCRYHAKAYRNCKCAHQS